jgi:thiamine biosynthesis lipoprotein
MRKRFLPPAILVIAVLVVALVRIWTGGQQYHSDSVLLMDTLVEVSVWGKGRVSAAAAADSAIAAIAGIDSLLGDAVFDAGCETALLGCPPVRSILDVCARANRLTGGLFDPTVGSVSRLWDFDGGGVVPDPDSLTVALSHIGLGRLLALEGPPASGQFVLDLGGVAKGHAVDLASAAVRRLGFRSAIINAGGDMRLVGRRPDGKPWSSSGIWSSKTARWRRPEITSAASS